MGPVLSSGHNSVVHEKIRTSSKKMRSSMYCLPIRAEKTFFSDPGYGIFHPDVICNKENTMKRFLTFLTAGLVSVFLFASAALAEDVKTDYFTLTLSDGWTMPKPVQSANGAVFAVVQAPDHKGAVSIAVTPVALPAKDLATQTLTNMKSGGFTVSEPAASGDSHIGEFSQAQTKGVSYFTANGKAGSVITIVGTDTGAGKEFMKKNFKPLDAKLFPASF